MLNGPVTILVNSTDSFSDCWQPFFTLLRKNLGNTTIPIVLNTERATFSFPGVKVLHSDAPRRSPAWSEHLMTALDKVETDYIVYLQEDYFLFGTVKTALLLNYVGLMEQMAASHILLIAPPDPGDLAGPILLRPELWLIAPYATHRVCLQAGIWHVGAMRNLLRKGETPWDFERYGTIRSYFRGDTFLAHKPEDHGRRYDGCIFPYVPTGLVRGRWDLSVVQQLFARHQIDVDFSVRGFLEQAPSRSWLRWRGRRLLFGIASLPARIWRMIGAGK